LSAERFKAAASGNSRTTTVLGSGPPSISSVVARSSLAEALVRALRAVGNNEVNYFITIAGHSSLEPETDSKLCAIMNDLPSISPFDRGGK